MLVDLEDVVYQLRSFLFPTFELHSRSIPDFDNPFPVAGTGMENFIPKFWEREREWQIAFPTFGNGKGKEKVIPNFREREWEAGIPGNGREREREWLLKIQSNFEFCP